MVDLTLVSHVITSMNIAVVGSFGCGKTDTFHKLHTAFIERGLDKNTVFHEETFKHFMKYVEPYKSTPVPDMSIEMRRNLQSDAIDLLLEHEKVYQQSGKNIHTIESYWGNIIPYTLDVFKDHEELVRFVKKRYFETIMETLYIFLDYKHIPVDPNVRDTDLLKRERVHRITKDVLEQHHAQVMYFGDTFEERRSSSDTLAAVLQKVIQDNIPLQPSTVIQLYNRQLNNYTTKKDSLVASPY